MSARRIRAMEARDLERVAALEVECFATAQAREGLEAELARSWAALLVAEDDAGHLVAYADVWRVADEVHVLNVAADPRRRREGHGRALMEAVLARARADGARRVLLEVRPSNRAAVGLYTALGFLETGRRTAYYDDGEDALLLELALPG